MIDPALISAIENQNLQALKDIAKTNETSLFNRDEQGKTLLHYAVQKNQTHSIAILQFLLDIGLDPLAVDQNFLSPLDISKQNNFNILTNTFLSRLSQQTQ